MKKILKVIVFFLILFLLLIIASYIVSPKNNGTLSPDKHIDNASGPLAEKENSIDALVIGDSESFAAISPLEIYKNYGYTMYVSGTSGQYLYNSYNYFLKTLTKQKLKVLILETDAIYRKIPISYNFRFWMGEFIPVFHYHNRWKQMTMQDFKMEMAYNYTDTFKGYDFSLNINPATNHNYMEYTEETEKIDKIKSFINIYSPYNIWVSGYQKCITLSETDKNIIEKVLELINAQKTDDECKFKLNKEEVIKKEEEDDDLEEE